MKNIMKFSILMISLLVLLVGCRDDEKVRFPELADGANMRITVDPDKSFFNFLDLGNARFAYDVNTLNTNVRSVEILAYFTRNDANGNLEIQKGPLKLETFSQGDFSDGHLSREYTPQQMVDLFSLGHVDSLKGGDLFNFRNVTTLDDGRVFSDSTFVSQSESFTGGKPRTITPNIIAASASTAFTCCFGTFVGCPSSIGGTYIVKTTALSTDGCCPNQVTVEYTTTLTQTGPTSYDVKDFSAGTYSNWYCAPYGLCAGTFEGLGAKLQDICGGVNLTAGYWGSAGTGKVDEATGVITIDWANVFGDAGTSVYTPQ